LRNPEYKKECIIWYRESFVFAQHCGGVQEEKYRVQKETALEFLVE